MPDDDEQPKKRVSLKIVGEGEKQTLLQRAEIGDEAATERSPAAWVILGAIAVFVVLVPLSMLSLGVAQRIYGQDAEARHPWPLVIVAVVSIVVSCACGGFLVGRFGPRVDARKGAFSGAIAGVVLWALSRTPLGFVLVLVAAPSAALGAFVGRRARKIG